MKAAEFALLRPTGLSEALSALRDVDTRVIAGGQSLGPMLNLRLVQPQVLIDLARVAELHEVEAGPDEVRFGALTTHAALEVLMGERGLTELMTRACSAAARRAQELAG